MTCARELHTFRSAFLVVRITSPYTDTGAAMRMQDGIRICEMDREAWGRFSNLPVPVAARIPTGRLINLPHDARRPRSKDHAATCGPPTRGEYLWVHNGRNATSARPQRATYRNHGPHRRLRSADRLAGAAIFILQKLKKIGGIFCKLKHHKAVAPS